MQLLKRVIHVLISHTTSDRGSSSLRVQGQCGSVKRSAVAVIITKLHDVTSVIQRKDVTAV